MGGNRACARAHVRAYGKPNLSKVRDLKSNVNPDITS